MVNRENWIVFNQSSDSLSLVFNGSHVIRPGKSAEILSIVSKDQIKQSVFIAELLDKKSIRIERWVDSVLVSTITSRSDLISLEIYDVSTVAIVTKTANYTILSTDKVVLGNASSGSIIITLPSAISSTGKSYIVKKIDATANSITIAPSGSDKIDGQITSIIINQYDSVTIVSNGTGWFII